MTVQQGMVVRIAAIAVVVAIVSAIGGMALWWALGTRTQQAKVDVGQAQAGSEAGVAALNISGEVAAGKATIDINVKGGSDAIRSAPGSDAPVSAESRGAALRALCGMRSYRDDARCAALLGTADGQRPDE